MAKQAKRWLTLVKQIQEEKSKKLPFFKGYFVLNRWGWSWTLLSATSAIILGFWADEMVNLRWWYPRVTYYFLWAVCLLAGWSIYSNFSKPHLFRKWVRVPLIASTGLITILFINITPEYRVLADETNLLGTSLSLYLKQTITNITQALHHHEIIRPIAEPIAHRPGLFPFLVACFHSVFGYWAGHSFVLNFLIGIATMVLAVRFGEKLIDKAYGWTAAILLLGFPLYALVVTSGAFDALNLFMLMAIHYQLYQFLLKPDGKNLECLLLLYVVGAHSRYETALLLLPLLVATGIHFRKLLKCRFSFRILLVPLLLLPLAWQRVVVGFKALQLMDGDKEKFMWEYVLRNGKHAFEFFFGVGNKPYPTSVPFSIFVAVGLFMLGWQLYKKRELGPKTQLIGLTLLGMFTMAMVQFAYSMGDISTPYNMRYALIYLGPFAFLAAYPFYRLASFLGGRPVLVGLLVMNTTVFWALAATNKHGKSLNQYREYRRNLEFLKPYPKNGTLVIADRPGMYLAHLYGAVKFPYLRRNKKRIAEMHEKKLYTNILIIEELDPKTKKPKHKIPRGFTLKPLHEYQNASRYIVRISKIDSVDNSQMNAFRNLRFPSSTGNFFKKSNRSKPKK